MRPGSFEGLASATRCISGLAGFLAFLSGRITAASRSTLLGSKAMLMTWGTPLCREMLCPWYPKHDTTTLVTLSSPASRAYRPSTSVMVPMLVPPKLTFTKGRACPDPPSKTLPSTDVWPQSDTVEGTIRRSRSNRSFKRRVVCLVGAQSKCPFHKAEAREVKPTLGW